MSALRSFEAVFRCGGVSQAAQELSVTSSAVSHQIRQLEADMNVKLVRREGRRIVLSEAGEKLFPALHEAFRLLASAVTDVHEQDTTAPLRVSMLQNFGVNWFLPRLELFRQAHPEIEIELSFDAHYVDFAREAVEIAVRHSPCELPNLHCELLFQDQLLVVCSIAFLAAQGPFKDPEQLLDHPLFVSDGRPADAWGKWFNMLGIDPKDRMREIHVSTSHLAIQGAANGTGLAIAGRRIMQQMMKRGALVPVFPHTVPEHGSYYIVCPKEWANRPKIRRFRYWLQDEAQIKVNI